MSGGADATDASFSLLMTQVAAPWNSAKTDKKRQRDGGFLRMGLLSCCFFSPVIIFNGVLHSSVDLASTRRRGIPVRLGRLDLRPISLGHNYKCYLFHILNPTIW